MPSYFMRYPVLCVPLDLIMGSFANTLANSCVIFQMVLQSNPPGSTIQSIQQGFSLD